jgi:hypothetical protein
MQAGFKRLAEASVGKLPSMTPQQVADLVVGFHRWVGGWVDALVGVQRLMFLYW